MINIPTKYKIIVGLCSVVVSFGLGRYSVAIQPTIKTEIQEAKKEDKKDDTDTHVRTVTVIVKAKDGSQKTTITQDTVKDEKEVDLTQAVKDIQQTVTPPVRSKINVSLLAAFDVTGQKDGLAYGASINKEIAGPITVGVFGLDNGIGGISIGINF